MVDNPLFIAEEFVRAGHMAPPSDLMRPASARMSPYFLLPGSSHSSAGSNSPPLSAHNLYQPLAHNFYYHVPVSTGPMWHLNPYKEDNLIYAAAAPPHFPRVQSAPNHQVQIPHRRISTSSITSVCAPVATSPRRKISVTKYQNIPSANYLQVPSFFDYGSNFSAAVHHGKRSSPSRDLLTRASSSGTRSRKTSSNFSSRLSKLRRSLSLSKEDLPQTTKECDQNSKLTRSRSSSLDRVSIPDPSLLPIPAFEFNSSHLPLRPPSISVNQYSVSGSSSTPHSQRIESRQMIRPTSSSAVALQPENKLGDWVAKLGVSNATQQAEKNIFSTTKPERWCRHADGKTCYKCQGKSDAISVCSSVNPPPTFTALDNYKPIRQERSFPCRCNAVFSISVFFVMMVMVFIGAFILYIETVDGIILEGS